MAKVLSGSFDTKPIINSRYLTFSWTATQDYEKNETTISWVLKCNGTATTYNKAAPFSVVIDGEEVYYDDKRIQLFVGDVVASDTKTLSHNSDGSKSFSASVKAAIYAFENNVSGSGSWDLADIPRGAVMTKVPTTFTDEDSPTIEFTNYLGNSVDSVSVCLSLDNYYSTIPYRAVGKTDKSYTFNFTDAEKAKIYEYTKNTNSLKVSFYILTVINGEEYRSKLFSTLKVINAKPVIDSFTVEETSTTDLTGSASKMIVEHNYITASAAYTLQKGAELDYIEIMNHKGEIFADSSAEFVDAISPIFEVYVRDSRGNEAYETVELEAINYIPLTCNIDAEIKLSETNTENAEVESRIYGNYFNSSFGAENNILSIKLEYNGSDGGYYEDIITLTSEDFDGNSYDKTIEKDSLSYKETWVVKAIAMDYITTASKESKQLTALPVFDWSKEDFNFNVPVSFSAGIDLPQTLLHTNKGIYLHGTQTVALDGDNALSKQTLGYYMVWYEYSGGSLLANNINYTFIPKYILDAANSKITMVLVKENGTCGAKTVSVSESSGTTTITGNAANDDAPNNGWVLRYVIGV